MTTLDIAKLRELLGRATKGRWCVDQARVVLNDPRQTIICDALVSPMNPTVQADMNFIAAAKNAMGELLDRLEKAETALTHTGDDR